MFKDIKVLVIGDLMLDRYVFGNVKRISPEAPVPIVDVGYEMITLGGAGNVVNNLSFLGAKVSIIGVIGESACAGYQIVDDSGYQITRLCDNLNVDAEGIIFETGRSTIQKVRVISGSHHIVRVDSGSVNSILDNTAEVIKKIILEKIEYADIILVSDYAKGVLRDDILSCIFQNKGDKKVLVDPKGKDYRKYGGAYLITPNRKEAELAAGHSVNSIDDLCKTIVLLHTKYPEIENVIITCGKDGMIVFDRENENWHLPSEAKQVFDVSGAGDTVLSVLGVCIASGYNLRDAAVIANKAAGIVVGKVGTAPIMYKDIRKYLK